MRCFVGLPLPKAYQDGLQSVSEAWRPRLRSKTTWTRPGNWHLTLTFLGELAEDVVSRVEEALYRVDHPTFLFQAGGAGFFPPGTQRAPRVVWAGLEKGAEETRTLAGMVQRAVSEVGFATEERPFRPHLTLARVREARKGDDWTALLRDLEERRWPEMWMRSFVLWQSVLSPSGPTYTVIREFALGRDES